MDDIRGKFDFVDSTSKLESIVQINSIAIDFSSSMEAIEPQLHEHFSIRGFVAGMRKKDRKTCFAFASVGNDVYSEDNLPPLYVPEFRWWQCSSCITNAEMKRTTEKRVVATKSDANTSSCENVADKNGLFIHRRVNTGSRGKTYIRDVEARNSCDVPEVIPQQVIKRLNNTPDMVCLDEPPFCIADEPDNASSGSDGTLSVLPNKRKPKLRLLADILVGDRNQTSSNPRARSASSCGMQAACTEMEAILDRPLEVDVPADVAKADRSPERKRKFAHEESEDGEPLAAICPRAAAKRLKGLVHNAEKNSRRVKSFDPEPKGGASMRLDLLRPQQIKPKKAKAIDTSKKMRRIHRDDEIGQMRDCLQPNAASSANLQEQALPMGTNLVKLGGDRSALSEIRHAHVEMKHALVEMRPCFRSSLSRQQVEKIDDISMPEVGADDDPFMPLSKSISGKCNIRGKVALGLSLDSSMDNERNSNDQESFREHRCIPDLNMEIPEKTATTEDQQFTILSEKRSLPIHKKMDASSSCSNENVREGKRQMAIPELKNNDNSVELGTSNEMEIVELLAKNQHERALGNARRHLLGINNSARENVPFRLSIPQKRPIQPCGMRAHSFSDQCHKGRSTITDMNDGKGKKAVSDVAKFKEGRFGSIYPLDPYSSNDKIPAMQLLSLMDQRVKSSSSFEIGTKSSLDKPFSPCKHHPRLNGKENHNLLRGSLLPQNSNSKDFSWLRYGVYSSGESSERASPNLRGQAPQELRNPKTTLLEGCSSIEKRHARSNGGLGDCTLNRNPADFSIPEVGNRFTLTAKDLKPRRRTTNALKVKLRTSNVDGRKRQRMRKNGLGKECMRS